MGLFRWVGSRVNRPIVVFMLLVLASEVRSQESTTETRLVPAAPLVSMQSTIRVEQGELLLFVGEERVLVQPRVWHPETTGTLSFEAQHQSIRYRFIAEREIRVLAEEEHTFARITVQPELLDGADGDAVVWTAWRHQPVRSEGQNTIGTLLGPVLQDVERSTGPLPWNNRWPWFFDGNTFMRDRFAVYGLPPDTRWRIDRFVRLQQLPYAPVAPGLMIGFIRASLAAGEARDTPLLIRVPYSPVERDAWLGHSFRAAAPGTQETPAD